MCRYYIMETGPRPVNVALVLQHVTFDFAFCHWTGDLQANYDDDQLGRKRSDSKRRILILSSEDAAEQSNYVVMSSHEFNVHAIRFKLTFMM